MIPAVEIRSPCFSCERAYENKLKCAKTCERLALFQKGLPQVVKYAEEASYHIGGPGKRKLRR